MLVQVHFYYAAKLTMLNNLLLVFLSLHENTSVIANWMLWWNSLIWFNTWYESLTWCSSIFWSKCFETMHLASSHGESLLLLFGLFVCIYKGKPPLDLIFLGPILKASNCLYIWRLIVLCCYFKKKKNVFVLLNKKKSPFLTIVLFPIWIWNSLWFLLHNDKDN